MRLRDVTLEGGAYRLGYVEVRKTQARDLKAEPRSRPIAIMPQYRPIIEAWVQRRTDEGATGKDLLFPGTWEPRDELRKTAALAGLTEALDGEACGAEDIIPYSARHTFVTTALNCLDVHGDPIAPWTISRWSGHGDTEMIEETYSHTGWKGKRTIGVSYRIEDYEEELRPRLVALEERLAAAVAERGTAKPRRQQKPSTPRAKVKRPRTVERAAS